MLGILGRMIREDVMRFIAIYLLVLVGFSQLFYVASNQQNQGVTPYLSALHRGFNATLKEVDFEQVRVRVCAQDAGCRATQAPQGVGCRA